MATSEKTCKGNLTNAGSNRFLQYMWNHIVNRGRTSIGVVSEPCLVLIKPISRSCEMIIAMITRLTTSGQNAAALSYCWLYTFMILEHYTERLSKTSGNKNFNWNS